MTERHPQQDLIDRTFNRFLKNQDNEIFIDQVVDTIEMNIANYNTQDLWLAVFNEFESMVEKIKTFNYEPIRITIHSQQCVHDDPNFFINY